MRISGAFMVEVAAFPDAASQITGAGLTGAVPGVRV